MKPEIYVSGRKAIYTTNAIESLSSVIRKADNAAVDNKRVEMIVDGIIVALFMEYHPMGVPTPCVSFCSYAQFAKPIV
jgi:hypothetical protein